MALTHVGTSAPVFTGTSVTPTIPVGVADGDHVFLLASAKQIARDFVASSYTDWTLLQNVLLPASTTAGNNVAGSGQSRVGVFYRVIPAGGLTAPTITLTGTAGATTISGGTLSVWRSDTGSALDIAMATGDDVSTVTAGGATAGSNPGFTVGDQVLLFSVLTDDAPRYNAFSVTATGATFSALTEVADAGSATGDDNSIAAHIGSVTAGTATAAPVFTATMSVGAGSTGGTTFIRLRETGGGTPAVAARPLAVVQRVAQIRSSLF